VSAKLKTDIQRLVKAMKALREADPATAREVERMIRQGFAKRRPAGTAASATGSAPSSPRSARRSPSPRRSSAAARTRRSTWWTYAARLC